MEIILYKNISAPNVMDKTLSDALTYSGATMRNELNVLEPEFLIEEAANLSGYNYCFCDYTNRYYFCDIIEDVTGFYRVMCKVDPLTSHKDAIRACTGTINRNSKLADGYLQDPEYIAKSYKQIVTKSFPSGLTDDTIILMTVG